LRNREEKAGVRDENEKMNSSGEFVISKVQTDGTSSYVESASSLEKAQTRVQALAHFWPGEYVILDRKTGRKISINPGEPQTGPLQ